MVFDGVLGWDGWISDRGCGGGDRDVAEADVGGGAGTTGDQGVAIV